MRSEADAEEFEKERKSLMDTMKVADRKEFGRAHRYGE